jgi:Contractile injection system tube protein
MERVAFLIERTGQQISCLLNPESVVARRNAGLRTRVAGGGIATGVTLSDDPVVATGGGVTELELDLLFDVDLARQLTPSVASAAGSPAAASPGSDGAPAEAPLQTDVRDLTRPIWSLAENADGDDGYGAPPVVRMIWGRSWNVPAVVAAVAERLERFSVDGAPQRSWLRLRLRRVSDAPSRGPLREPATPQFETPPLEDANSGEAAPRMELPVDDAGFPGRRLDEIAAERYGDPGAWRFIATINGIDNPLAVGEGLVLRLDGADSGRSA